MNTIECTALVDEKHQALVQFPEDVTPGEHQIVVLIDQHGDGQSTGPLEDLPTISVGRWPTGLSLRREDMYDNG